MLNIFRSRGIANAVYGVVIIATILVFVIQFRPDSGKKTASCNRVCRVTVRGWCVEPKEYNATLRMGAQYFTMVAQQTRREIPARLQQSLVLDGLVERELLISEAERLGLAVSDAELNEQIVSGYARLSLPGNDEILNLGFRDPKTHAFDAKGYKQKLRMSVGLNEADFRELQRRELLAAKVRDMVRSFVRASEPEAYQGYVGEKNTATVEYVTIRDAFIKRWGVHVKDEEVAAWAAKNQAEIDKAFDKQKEADLPKEGRVRHILVMFQGETAEAHAEALKKISAIGARIKKGESFPEVAREVSEDPGSKDKGGKYDTEEMKGFQKPWLDQAEKLKPGEVSPGVVATTHGYHLMMKDDPAKTEADLAPGIKKGIARLLFIDAEAKRIEKEYSAKIAAAMKAGKTGEDAVKDVFADFGKAPKTDKVDKNEKPVELLKVLTPEELPAAADAGAAASGDAGVALAMDGGKALADAGPKPTTPPPAPPKDALTPETDPDRPRAQISPPLTKEADPIPGLTPPSGNQFLDFAFSAKDGEVRDEPFEAVDGLVVAKLKERHIATKEDWEKAKDDYLATMLRQKQAEALGLYLKQLREVAEKAREVTIPPVAEGDGGAQPIDMGGTEDENQ